MARVELTGLEDFINAVQRLGSEGKKIENKALKEAGAVMQKAIQNVTPVRTGKLKNSITVSGIRTQDGVKYVAIGPSKDGWYCKFLEFGTVKIRAKPFMAPGYENGKEQAMATIKEELRRGLGL